MSRETDFIDWQFQLPADDKRGIYQARRDITIELDMHPDGELTLESFLEPPITQEKVWRIIGTMTLLKDGIIEQSTETSVLGLTEAGQRRVSGIKALSKS